VEGGLDKLRFPTGALSLTQAGHDVVAGRCDWIRLAAPDEIDRWLGGVHLSGREPAWRWDPTAGRLVPAGHLVR